MPLVHRKLVRPVVNQFLTALFITLAWGIAFAVLLLAVIFVIDAVLRLRWKNKPTFRFVMGDSDTKQLLVVFPGAFSEAKFQLQPVVANLRYRGHVLYVEQRGKRYSALNTAIKTAIYVADLVKEGGVDKIHLLGTSQGAAVAVMAAQQMRHGSLVADNIRLDLIAVDGVGRPDDLVMPNWAFGLIGKLPFGPIWDLIGPLRWVVQPSATQPHPMWAAHAKQGLAMARSVPTAFWADQMRELGGTRLKPSDFRGLSKVTYISSTEDVNVIKPANSRAFWASTVTFPTWYKGVDVKANHSDYEADPEPYAMTIDKALAS